MDLDQYARLCAWTTRIGLCDDHVVEFSWKVYEAGFLDNPDRWVELIADFVTSEYKRTGKHVEMNRDNTEIQFQMADPTSNWPPPPNVTNSGE